MLRFRPGDQTALAALEQAESQLLWNGYKRAAEAGDVESALAALRTLVAKDPDYRSGEARQRLFETLIVTARGVAATGDCLEAVRLLDEARRLKPELADLALLPPGCAPPSPAPN